jgi:hypothetical protein
MVTPVGIRAQNKTEHLTLNNWLQYTFTKILDFFILNIAYFIKKNHLLQ